MSLVQPNRLSFPFLRGSSLSFTDDGLLDCVMTNISYPKLTHKGPFWILSNERNAENPWCRCPKIECEKNCFCSCHAVFILNYFKSLLTANNNKLHPLLIQLAEKLIYWLQHMNVGIEYWPQISLLTALWCMVEKRVKERTQYKNNLQGRNLPGKVLLYSVATKNTDTTVDQKVKTKLRPDANYEKWKPVAKILIESPITETVYLPLVGISSDIAIWNSSSTPEVKHQFPLTGWNFSAKLEIDLDAIPSILQQLPNGPIQEIIDVGVLYVDIEHLVAKKRVTAENCCMKIEFYVPEKTYSGIFLWLSLDWKEGEIAPD